MANSKKFDEGYQAAIEAIKKILNGETNNQQNSSQASSAPAGMDTDLGDTEAGQKSKENGGEGQTGPEQQGSGNQSSSGGGQSGGQTGDGEGSGNQGVVTAEDCAGQYGSDIPSTPGGFMDAEEGRDLAKKEGYGDTPSEGAVNNTWKEASIKATQKDNRTDAHGSRANLFSKIQGLWKTHSDWKREFKKIVGRALNTSDKRQAYANKNILATQNRVARTDKDKFDAVDYVTVFIDSSGSMTDDMLKYILSEVYSIACQIKPETLVAIQLDTSARDIQIFHNVKEFKKYAKVATVKGRGGNRQAAAWELLRDDPRFKKHPSELVIMFTDGWLDQHKRDPKTMNNLCWVIIDNPSFRLEYKEPRTTCVYLDSTKIK